MFSTNTFQTRERERKFVFIDGSKLATINLLRRMKKNAKQDLGPETMEFILYFWCYAGARPL